MLAQYCASITYVSGLIIPNAILEYKENMMNFIEGQRRSIYQRGGSNNNKDRVFVIDNVRAVLITAVVFGHMLEKTSFYGSEYLYMSLYSFHMPAFAFVSGLCFSVGSRKSLQSAVCAYFVFQFLYLLGSAWDNGKALSIQFTTPGWILWYLLSMVLWYVITDVLYKILPNSSKSHLIALLVSVITAILVGFDNTVGYYMSLSRTIVFFPFFLAGEYIKSFCNDWPERQIIFPRMKKARVVFLLPAVFMQIVIFIFRCRISSAYFYCAEPYDSSVALFTRILMFMTSSSMILALFSVMPNKKIPFLTYVGQNTFPIYIMQGLAVRIAYSTGLLSQDLRSPLLNVCIATVVCIALLSSPPVSKPFNALFRFRYLGRKRRNCDT